MPINAKPEYFKAEGKYYQAETTAERIKALEEMLSKAPSHKGAEKLRAGIKQKLSKQRELLSKEKQKKGSGRSFAIKKDGAAQIVLVSLPNAGKSTLLSNLTNAKPQIADYDFTTRTPEVGIMDHRGVQIQVVEIPAFYNAFAYSENGPAFMSIIRNADLVIVLLDSLKDPKSQKSLINLEFEKAQIKINAEHPPIRVKKSSTGGIAFVNKHNIKSTEEEMIRLLHENGMHNITIDFYGKVTIEDLAEAINESLVYMRCIYVHSRSDLIKSPLKPAISKEAGLDWLRNEIWKKLKLIKAYTKSPGKTKDFPPIALKRGSKVKDLAIYIHKDFLKKFKFARVWGKSAKFEGQSVGMEHTLKDEDVVELHLK
ncbi:MAG: GTPase [Candidatus Woesearchaeota archaeon]